MPKKPAKIAKNPTTSRRSKRPQVNYDSISDYAKNYQGPRTNSTLGPEDFAWIGKDGTLDGEALLENVGYEPEGPLRLILGAIIAAHPTDEKRTNEDRLLEAEAALLGTHRKRGNRESDDEELLHEIGNRFFEEWLKDTNATIDVGPIVRKVLNDREIRFRMVTEESVVRRLQRKFDKDRDRILARVTRSLKWYLLDFYKRLLRVISDLQALGVEVDSSLLWRRINPGEPKAHE